MADQDESTEKSFDPTPRKLEEARRRGEIVRSSDLNTAIAYGGLLIGSVLFGPWLVQTFGSTMQGLLERADTTAPLILAPGGAALAGAPIGAGLLLLGVLVAIPAVLLIASLIPQNAIIFTPSKLEPKLSRISIIQNAKNKFGSNGIFEFFKSSVKLLIYTLLLATFLIGRSNEILGSLVGSDGQIFAILVRQCRDFLLFVFLIALIIGGVDYFWQWSMHIKKNRMTRKEITDESKENDGDPHLKQERRQRGYEIASNRMLADVPDAAVVIVNPSHFAVALKWDRSDGTVPICIAKGVDATAARIREVANESGVPIFRDPPTARLLHTVVDIGAPIERDHFRAVAAAIRFADMMRARAGQR